MSAVIDKPATQIDVQLLAFNESINRLADIASSLQSKLQLVLRQEPTEDQPALGEQSELIPLAHAIRDSNNSLRTQINKIEFDVLNLIEL